MKKSSKTLIHTFICIGLMCILFVGYFNMRKWMEAQIVETEDDYSWAYEIESTLIEEDELVLEGFAFRGNVDAVKGSFEIVLQDVESKKNYFANMEYEDRVDVNKYFLCEYDYLQSGFKAKFKKKKLNINERCYEVLLRLKGKDVAYRIGAYLVNGEIEYANPKEYIPLDVAGTDLEWLVEEGTLRVYRPDCGMYVYQHENDLYWVADPSYKFVDGDTCVQFQLYTTQVEKLPEARLINHSDWDSIAFSFCENELIEFNTGKYRVTKKAIPTEYSVKTMETGYLDNGWVWQQYFRPCYNFRKANNQ